MLLLLQLFFLFYIFYAYVRFIATHAYFIPKYKYAMIIFPRLLFSLFGMRKFAENKCYDDDYAYLHLILIS